MSIKRLRICMFCHRIGITIELPNGNQLRTHIRIRHPQSKEQVQQNKRSLREYRKQLLLTQERLRRRTL